MFLGDPRGVWFDIADTDEEAAELTARSELMTAIRNRITSEGWTQPEAADALGVAESRVSDLLGGKLSAFGLQDLTAMAPERP